MYKPLNAKLMDSTAYRRYKYTYTGAAGWSRRATVAAPNTASYSEYTVRKTTNALLAQ